MSKIDFVVEPEEWYIDFELIRINESGKETLAEISSTYNNINESLDLPDGARYFEIKNKVLAIWGLYSYIKNKGYASYLLIKVFEYFKLKGEKEIYLCCEENNIKALNLYKKHQFYMVDKIENEYENILLLRKQL